MQAVTNVKFCENTESDKLEWGANVTSKGVFGPLVKGAENLFVYVYVYVYHASLSHFSFQLICLVYGRFADMAVRCQPFR